MTHGLILIGTTKCIRTGTRKSTSMQYYDIQMHLPRDKNTVENRWTRGYGSLQEVKKSKVKYVELYSASSWSTSNALPLPVSQCWTPQANPTVRQQRTLRDHMIRLVYHVICLLRLNSHHMLVSQITMGYLNSKTLSRDALYWKMKISDVVKDKASTLKDKAKAKDRPRPGPSRPRPRL